MYPDRLIPNRDKLGLFNNFASCYLIRRSDIEGVVWSEIEGKLNLNPSAVSIRKPSGVSCNIFDPTETNWSCCIAEDIKIRLTNDSIGLGLSEWNPESEEVINAENISCDDSDIDFYLLAMSDIHEIRDEYPFNRPGKPEERRNYILKLRHAPSLVNICHYEIDSFKIEDDQSLILIDQDSKGNWIKDIKHTMRQRILTKAKHFSEIL